jgi:hypothetical protein
MLARVELWELASRRSSQAFELTSSLRLGTIVPSQNLSGAWVTIHG